MGLCKTSNCSIFTFIKANDLKLFTRSYSSCVYLMMRFKGPNGNICKMMTSHFRTLLWNWLIIKWNKQADLVWFRLCTAKECKTYTTLQEADRNEKYAIQNGWRCDKNIVETWYRFTGDAGNAMPTKCVPIKRCRTQATGWLNGMHPTPQEGNVSLDACFHWQTDCCEYRVPVKVRNCGLFYVYYLKKPPLCELRYCATQKNWKQMQPGLNWGDSLFLTAPYRVNWLFISSNSQEINSIIR